MASEQNAAGTSTALENEQLTTDQVFRYARDLRIIFKKERDARQALEERQNDLEMLIEAHGAMSRCLDLRSVLEIFLNTLSEQVGGCRLMLFARVRDDEDGYPLLAFREREGLPSPDDVPAVSDNHPVIKRFSSDSLSPLEVSAADRNSAAWIKETYPSHGRPKNIVCFPLAGRHRTMGFVAADAGPEELAFDQARGSIITLLTRQAGIQIENVTLFEQVQSELDDVMELVDQQKKNLLSRNQFENLVGATPQMQAIFDLIRTVSDVQVPVLITGETGTGKDMVAQGLHFSSKRKDKPFVSVNCAAMPGELVESELFGHEKGAFTGAVQQRRGKVEMAEGGTLFLDEIAEMPANLQAKLLRFLQERTYERVGGARSMRADVRIIAATNQDVDEAIKDGRLRMDLVYRLNTITFELPPLRERLNDIPLLLERFVTQANERYGCSITGVHRDVPGILMGHEWPGNVRELKNVVDRAVILTHTGTIQPESVHFVAGGMEGIEAPVQPGAFSTLPGGTETDKSFTELKQEIVERFEQEYLDKLLRETGGNISQAARNAQIDKKNFIDKMRRYDIDRKDYLQ